MGQKVNPHGLRVGVNKEWSSSWIANKKEFSTYLVEDNKIRKFINKSVLKSGNAKDVFNSPEFKNSFYSLRESEAE